MTAPTRGERIAGLGALGAVTFLIGLAIWAGLRRPSPAPPTTTPAAAPRICVPRLLTPEFRAQAALRSMAYHSANAPDVRPGHAADLQPRRIASETAKRWRPGTTLKVGFQGGSATIQARVLKAMGRWSEVCQVDFVAAPFGQAQVRVGFLQGQGSWSYIGTDILSIPVSEITMNLGWLGDDTDDEEVRRVVVHETGHTLSFDHEAQFGLATGELRFNTAAIYAYFEGPPNYWTKQDVDQQILTPLTLAGVQHSDHWDKYSIMEYFFDRNWIVPPTDIPNNTDLSPTDIAKAQEWYGPRGTVPGPTGPAGPAGPAAGDGIPLAVGDAAVAFQRDDDGSVTFALTGTPGAVWVHLQAATLRKARFWAAIGPHGGTTPLALTVRSDGSLDLPKFPGGPLDLIVASDAPAGTPIVAAALAYRRSTQAPRKKAA